MKMAPLLASEAEIDLVKTSSRGHFRRALAALRLAGFAFVVVRPGFGKPLFACALLSGSKSMLLAWFNSRQWITRDALRDVRKMRNPFQYGGVVGGPAFCNRVQEIADLLRASENGEKLFIYS